MRITSVSQEIAPDPHCIVSGVIGTETNFELLLPDDWNGKFVMGGGGGFVGSVVNTALGYGVLKQGFATVGTDTGHRGSALDASWALNNLERLVSFGHQAVHRTAVTAKALIADYYGRDSSRNLFFGCSRGVEPNPDYPDPETPSAHFAFGNGVMRYLVFHDQDWDYSTYDFSTFQSDIAAVSSTLDATDPNLDAFRAQGGRLLIFNGWRDMALTPLGTIKYYEEVIDRDATAAGDVRLIMVPGMDHCIGGPGATFVNWIDEIDKWVETDKAPDQVMAYWIDEQMQPGGSRLACAYPQQLKYSGEGNPRDASSFSCVQYH